MPGGADEAGRVDQDAADLEIAPGTVARAYRELETAGLIESRGRRGTRVGGTPPTPIADEREARLAQAADEFALRATELGADLAEATTALQAALASRAGGAA